MTDVGQRARFLVNLARQLHNEHPDFALADIVQIVCASIVAEKLTP